MHIKSFLRTFLVTLFFSLTIPAYAEPSVVDINLASAQEIAAVMKGVGEKKAEAIVAYRTQFGPFKQLDDLTNVRGIGAGTLDKNRALLTLSTVESPTE
ncbi:MAG: ComEA family DNA-binding protein [Pontibacterium sp.]